MKPEYGFTDIDITPRNAVEVSPFRPLPWRKDKLMDGVHDNLKCTVMYSSLGDYSCFIISIDATWVSRELADTIKAHAETRYGVPGENVVVAATHTHSGPQLLPGCEFYGRMDEDYVRWLKEQIKQAMREARGSVSPGGVKLARHELSSVPIAVRYRYVWDMAAMRKRYLRAPDFEKPFDSELRIAEFRDCEGLLLGVLLNMSAHPVFHSKNTISADYPGKLRVRLAEMFGEDVPVLFLQGFCGDVRPAYVESGSFRGFVNRLRYGMSVGSFRPFIDDHLEDFAESVVGCISENGEAVCTKGASEELLVSKSIELRPFNGVGDHAVTVQRTDIPGGFSIIAVSGEVFSGYMEVVHQAAGRADRLLMPVGYANGMYGYIPDKEQFECGRGYELESWEKFGRPRPLTAEFGECFASSLLSLLDDCTESGAAGSMRR